MAPAKKRGNQFFDVGVQGRKTGITLQDRGIRDEHGMEPVSGIFSSPTKPTPRAASARRSGGTVTASSSMDIQQSSIPEIADTVKATQLLRSGKAKPPPPLARSPMKTSLGATPRRLSAKPMARRTATPGHPVSSPTVTRRLSFNTNARTNGTPVVNGSASRRVLRRSIYDIVPSSDSEQEQAMEETVIDQVGANEISTTFPDAPDESYAEQLGEEVDAAGIADVESAAEEAPEVVPEPVKQSAKRGRKRKSDEIEFSDVEERPVVPAQKKATAAKRRSTTKAPFPKPQTTKGRRKTLQKEVEESNDSWRDSRGSGSEEETISEADVDREEEDPVPSPKPPTRRGRPPKKRRPQEEYDQEEEAKQEPIFKKPLPVTKGKGKAKSKAKSIATTTGGATGDLGEDEAYASQPDVNGGATYRSASNMPDDATVTSNVGRYARGRTLSVLRRTAIDDVPRSRHGRPIVRPVNFWNNEKVIVRRDGTVEGVERAIETIPEERSRSASAPKRGRQPKPNQRRKRAPSPEVIEELEEWEENEPGSLIGDVLVWDPQTGMQTDEEFDITLAMAEGGIEPRDVPGSTFRFAKVFQQEFLSCGIVELPVGGEKRTKNSRRMHMMFFVASGVVEVTVHQNSFTIHKGGVWQVPRGNFYSIRNVGDGESRLFFAQACETEPEE